MIEISDEPVSFDGACHCGAVSFRVHLPRGLASARRCDCSFCRMRGAVAVTAEVGGLEVVQGEDKLTLYTFNTGVARHYFCSVCGIYTHHQRRSNPSQYGVNAACLSGVSPFDFPEVVVNNGIEHPSDRSGRGAGTASDIAGILRFEPTS